MPAPTFTPLARVLRSRSAFHAVLLAVLAYVPALLAKPGKIPADTKLYLYLNPGRLMSDATAAWDPRQFGGSVPHQTVSYLWPSGPWYWICEHVGMPDWVAHRLWIGTVLVCAGLGARWAAKHLGLTASAALVVGVIYQLSPYVLPYVSRTSTMLLPWAGLGWMVALTIRAATQTRWRDVALFGLVMFTVGSTNATATLMIAPAPVLWLVHAAKARLVTTATAIRTAAKIGFVSLGVSASWIAMVSSQSAYGANVLGYTETLEAVSQTATSNEVLRGMGYWLFYVRDPSGFTTSAAFRYMSSGQLIFSGFALVMIGLLGLVITNWISRRYAFWLVLAGTILAVGVHPIGQPSPLMAILTRDTRSGLSLALRSSSRAAPLLVFGLALGAGAVAQSLRGYRSFATTKPAQTIRHLRRLGPAAICVLAIVNLPALRTGELVDANLLHDKQPPQAWKDAAAALDAAPSGYRVMQLPASESAAYRWGYTVDPPLPALTTRAEMVRDWTPLGTAAAMDLLYALDDRFQDGTAEAEAVAPIARLLGVDTIWLANDIAFERFRSARPEPVAALLTQNAHGLGPARSFGPPEENIPVLPMVDEQQLSDAQIGLNAPAVALVPVENPTAIVRAKTNTVIVSGSGDGLVDAAAAGVLDGSELILYSADHPDAIASSNHVIVTDSNRDRAHQWRGAQDVWGFTEDGSPGSGVTKFDSADQRLPVFANQSAATMTIAEQRGNLAASASAYGELLGYRPEDRAANAIDNKLDTAWIVGDHATPEGESIQLVFASPISALTVVQPQDTRNRWITEIDLTGPGGFVQHAQLSDQSRTESGQTIVLTQPTSAITLTIRATEVGTVIPGQGLLGVGFAEMRTSVGTTEEITRLPTDALSKMTGGAQLDVVLTRLRTRGTNRYRSDPEPTMTRAFTLDTPRTFATTLVIRVNSRATDEVIAQLLGWSGTTATRRLLGAPANGGWAATDADESTTWISPFGSPIGSALQIPVATDQPISSLTLVQPQAGEYAVITEVSIASGDEMRVVAVPPADASGRSTLTFQSVPAHAQLDVTITKTNGATTVDRRYGELFSLPIGITELTGAGIVPTALPSTIDSGCRTDLLSVNQRPLAVRFTADTRQLLAGQSAAAVPCDATDTLSLPAGESIWRTTAGAATGIDVDRIVLSSAAQTEPARVQADAPSASVVAQDNSTRTIRIGPCPTDCWLVFGEGYNVGWTATIDGRALPTTEQVDGGFNGWLLPPARTERTMVVTWTPQSRLDKGLALTAITVLLCGIGAACDRRRRVKLRSAVPQFAWERQSIPVLSGASLALSSGALAALLVSPRVGLVVGIGSAIGIIGLRRPQLVGLVGIGVYGVIAWITARQVATTHPTPGFGWPAHWEWLHHAGLAALFLVGVAATSVAVEQPAPAVASPLPSMPER